MLVDRIVKETTDISRDFLDMSWWLDEGEHITSVVSQKVILGAYGWSDAPYPLQGGEMPYDPFPLEIDSAVVAAGGTQLEVFVSEGSPSLAYTCQFVLDGSSSRRVTIEMGVQVTGVPLGALGSGPLPSYLAVTIADTPPTDPQPGQLWFDSIDPQLYIWYDDPSSSQWVITTSDKGGLSTDAPYDGRIYGRLNGVWTPTTSITGGGANTDPNNIKAWGAIVDGNSHPLSQTYPTLAAAQAVYPHATSLNDEIDWCAIQAAVNALEKVIYIPGWALINRPVISTSTTPITVLGDGVNVSSIIQTTAGADGWQHTSTLGFQMFGLTLSCNGVGGTALKLDFGVGSVSQVTLRDVYIVGNIFNPAGGGQLSNYWHDGIYCKNPSIMQLDHIWILGSNGGYLGNMGDAIYLKCRIGPPSGTFDIGMRDSRIHSYQRGMVLDSINDATGNPTAINMQGIMLERVNYGALMQFVTVIGSCLELVLSHCQGASFGSVLSADRANTVTIRDGLFFASAAGTGAQAILTQVPQDMISASGGGYWWVKDNEFVLSPSAAVNYIFDFSNNFLRAALRDNMVYITSTATAVGFANIGNGSLQITESGTTFSNWRGWPLWTNGNTDAAAGSSVPSFQTLVTRGQPNHDQWAGEGSVIGWNYGGAGGRTSFINSRATAVGGFEWYSIPSPNLSTDTPTLLSTLTADGAFYLFGDGTVGLTCTS